MTAQHESDMSPIGPAPAARRRRRLYESASTAPAEPVPVPPAASAPVALEAPSSCQALAAPEAPREIRALAIVSRYMRWSMGASLIPVPGVDSLAISGVQLKMLAEVSEIYGVPFSRSRAQSIVAALCGGLGVTALGNGLIGQALRLIPFIGPLAALAAFPALAAAATLAIGKVFIQHYEMGGTLLNLRPEETRAYFAEQFQAAKGP